MKKQILMLMGVATLTYASANLSFVETTASLSQPTNWDIGYINSPASADYLLTTKTIGTGTGSILNPAYTRTADGSYYNYQAEWDNGDFPAILPNGLTINTTFNRSNTTWSSSGTGLYYPQGGSIGSDNTVGTPNKKIHFVLNNQTNKNYLLSLDISSTSHAFTNFRVSYDGIYIGGWTNTTEYPVIVEELAEIYVPAFFEVELYTFTSADDRDKYFDSWYLQDLGVSAAYNEGYIVGENDGYDSGLSDGYDVGFEQGEIVGYEDGYENGLNNGLAATPIENIFTAIFSGIANIFNIQIFGNITLGTIIIAPIAVALLWYILGIVSGVGGKK
jgi:hypothetical protein